METQITPVAPVLTQPVKLFTCVVATAFGALVVFIISVFCGESHASAVGQGIRHVTREVADMKNVVFGWILQ